MPARMPKPPTTPGLPRQTQLAMKEMSQGQLECTIYSFHAYAYTGQYRPYNPGETGNVRHIAKLLMREQECQRCGTIRTDILDARTLRRVGAPKYDRPDNWLPPGIPRGVKPSVIAEQEAYRRVMERVAHAEPGQRAHAER